MRCRLTGLAALLDVAGAGEWLPALSTDDLHRRSGVDLPRLVLVGFLDLCEMPLSPVVDFCDQAVASIRPVLLAEAGEVLAYNIGQDELNGVRIAQHFQN